jgi:hypothetical protein
MRLGGRRKTMSLSKIMQSAFAGLFILWAGIAEADGLKPYILGETPAGDVAQVVSLVKVQLANQGFQVVGTYSPYSNATVIVATNPELKAAAAKAENGGFGAGQRVAVTEVFGKIQVSYYNPAYLSTAYGLGKLEKTEAALKTALGVKKEFGSVGMEADRLKPGVYHYSVGMPYFNNVDVLGTFPDHKTALEAVEKNLAAGKAGTKKVYRIDLPGKEASVFGVAITQGDGADKKVMDIIDYRDERSTAHLPYEVLVQGNQVLALRGRYRIAVDFPDLTMFGKHGFSKIMPAPGGILNTLTAVATP